MSGKLPSEINDTQHRDTRKLSLRPLDFETALTAALQVEPPSKEKEPTPPQERRPRKKKQAE